MQLSVSTSPAEPNLASLLLGGEGPVDGATTAVSGEAAQPFADIFAEFAPGVTATDAAQTAPAGGLATGAPTPWVGSSLPDMVPASTPPPGGPTVCAPAAQPATKLVATGKTEEAETPMAEAQPETVPAADKPAPRSGASHHGRTSSRAARRLEESAAHAAPATLPLPVLNEVNVAPSPAQPLSAPTISLETSGEASVPETVSEVCPDTTEAESASSPHPFGNAISQYDSPRTAQGKGPVLGQSRRVSPQRADISVSDFPASAQTGSPISMPVAPVSGQPAAGLPDAISTEIQPVADGVSTAGLSQARRERPVISSWAAGIDSSDELVALPASTSLPETLERESTGPSSDAPRTFAPAELLARQFASVSLTASAKASGSDEATPLGPVFRDLRRPVAEAPVVASAAVEVYREESVLTSGLGLLDSSALLPREAAAPVSAPAGDQVLADESSLAEVQSAMVAVPVRPSITSGASTPEKAASGRGAKIAASAPKFSDNGKLADSGFDKNFLSSGNQDVANSDEGVGTGVAKTDLDMTSLHSNRPASAAVPAHVPVSVSAVVGADRASDSADSSQFSPEVTGAQRAVEAVLTAADRFSAGDRHTVNLHFSVGGNDLNVRVELRADEVHATFRTDSPELRSALAHEWQAVNGGTESERSLRFASPVFAANSGQPGSVGLSSFSGGDSSSRQREGSARRSSDETFEIGGVRSGRSPTRGTSETVATAAMSASPVTTTTSRRLHVHA